MNHPLPPAPRRGRLALNLAATLLGVLLFGQLAAIGWALHRKHRKVGPLAGGTPPVATVTLPPPPATAASDATSATAATAVDPAPVPPETPVDPFPIADERVRFFLGGALASREQGDMKAALTQLRAANDLLPNHPRLLYELASTYEAMTLPAKASPVWDQLSALGETAGMYFKLAQARFEQGDARPPREVDTPLRLGKILERAEQAPGGGEAVTLRIPVQALDGATIDPGRVSVVTQFYDEVAGEIVETDALTENHRWLSGEFPSWTTNSVEFLDQPYRRLSPAEAGPADGRRYHGYVVKLYYDDHLQDVVAKPAPLASRRAEPGERGREQPAERLEAPGRRSYQLDDALFPPLPQ